MDYYVIGKLDEQQDRACQAEIRRLYSLHRQCDSWFSGASALADVCVLAVNHASPGSNPDELKGLVTLLSEAHILYDVVEESALERFDLEERFKYCRLIILPSMAHIPAVLAAFLDAYVARGGKLLLTGMSGSQDKDGNPSGKHALTCAGITAVEERPFTRGAYFALGEEDHLSLPHLDDVDWIPLDTPWLAYSPAAGSRSWLRSVPVGMFGPPEKCYYTASGEEPGLVANQYGAGICAVIPWQIGAQQYRFPTHAIAGLLSSAFERILAVKPSVHIDAPEVVEVSAFTQADGKSILVGLVNLSGQNGRMAHAPLPVEKIRIGFPISGESVQAHSLVLGPLDWEKGADGMGWVTLPRLDLCDMLKLRNYTDRG